MLNGTHKYPEDFEEATKELCKECARIRLKVPKNSVSSHMDCKDWRDHWRGSREETSSSFSGRHFGCYKAAMSLDYITHFQALFATLVMHHGLVMERWARGLFVILEKILGFSLVSKLRAILLLEAGSNCAYKMIFGYRMMENNCHHNLVPTEIYITVREADKLTMVHWPKFLPTT